MPFRHLVGSTYQLGTGYHSRWLNSLVTDATPCISVDIARKKMQTAKLLKQFGLPGAVHEKVNSLEEAQTAAETLGYPVVVKPADRDRGRGVAADLRDAESVAKAFEQCRAVSQNVLIERHAEGFTYRLSVFNRQLIKATKRVAAGVIGDGLHSVAELVDIRRNDEDMVRLEARKGRRLLELDEEATGVLAQLGMHVGSVPAEGQYVRLRRRDNVNAGGTNVPIPIEEVHPDNHALAIRVAAALRLDFAGVDIITSDITKSWLEVGALVCEVNAQPEMAPTGTPQIFEVVLKEMMPGRARIPVHLLILVSGSVDVQRVLETADKLGCETVAVPQGLYRHAKRVSQPFANGFYAACAALYSSETRSLLFMMAPAGILRLGLPIDRVDSIQLLGMENASPNERQMLREALSLVRENINDLQAILT
jgi:cyanophycin synthetase